ncbi:hypothetical protein AKH17_00150 [Pelagibacteraceae bacterium GOM-A2]|nr:hypothetical protein AKH17_00150 [Pelagibacteraceae bacterium GOM-A2]
MINNNEKGFALVLSLVLMLVMSLMGGALIVISAGDHQSNNRSDEYQQTFYVAETALLEGERYVLNQSLGPWNISNHQRDMSKRNLPNNTLSFPTNMTQKNYNSKSMSSDNYLSQSDTCYNSFQVNKPKDYKVVVAESWNFGVILDDSIGSKTIPKNEIDKLKKFYYQYFIEQVGSAPFKGTGTSVKKDAGNTGSDGIAYRVYGCGIKKEKDDINLVVALESVIVLPK